MGELYQTAASLRIYGDDLDPDEVTAVLGKSPSATARKGDVLYSGQKRERISRVGFWRLETERLSPGDLDTQVSDLFKGTNDDVAAWRSITSKFNADLFCGLFLKEEMEGLSLSPATLKILGDRRITLELDIYAGEHKGER